MANQFGPWATLMDVGGSPQLSAFWRRRMTMLAPTSQISSTPSRRATLCLVVAGVLMLGLPTYRVVVAGDNQPLTQATAQSDQTKKLTAREFARLSEKQQKVALLDGIRENRRKYANISLKTTSSVRKVDVNPTTKEMGEVLDDYGSRVFELQRIGGSYRLELNRYDPGVADPTVRATCHYDAESGVNRGIGMERLANGKEQEHGLISTEHEGSSQQCRYASYLGGVGFLGFPENDFLGFLLQHENSLQIRGVDQRSGQLEVSFTYVSKVFPGTTGSCVMWFEPEKNWMLVKRIWERVKPTSPVASSYERFEVKESKVFDGVWMPTRFTEVTMASREGVPTPMGNLWNTTAEDIKIGSVKKEDIEVVFSPGTLVRDQITGNRWGVGKSGEKIPYNDNVGEGP
ncbi:MAG: hypothetical protein GX621_02420 [Pirellulaceae bacterium]|nr:hypothetical protein [Pirellulaceae bacterium]